MRSRAHQCDSGSACGGLLRAVCKHPTHGRASGAQYVAYRASCSGAPALWNILNGKAKAEFEAKAKLQAEAEAKAAQPACSFGLCWRSLAASSQAVAVAQGNFRTAVLR